MPEMSANIVVVEDEQQIRRFVKTVLEKAGFAVFEAATGQQGLVEIGTRQPDVVIVDLGLPDLDGTELIRQVRGWSAVPIIILSARSQESEKVCGLDAGADDYLTKPFGAPELLARIRAHLRRRAFTQDDGSSSCEFGDIRVDLAKRSVSRAGQQIHLTQTEYRLLAMLVRNAGRVVTQRQLLLEVWGPAFVESGHYLRVYMGHLRQKLERDPAQPRYLLTETGVGYRLLTA